jgi:hypothetical protein
VSHVLRTTAFVSPCGGYATKPSATLIKQCSSWLGPTQPGVTTPDPTRQASPHAAERARRHHRRRRPARRAAPRPPSAGSTAAPAPAPAAAGAGVGSPAGVLDNVLPPLPEAPKLPPAPRSLLDYLLGS